MKRLILLATVMVLSLAEVMANEVVYVSSCTSPSGTPINSADGAAFGTIKCSTFMSASTGLSTACSTSLVPRTHSIYKGTAPSGNLTFTVQPQTTIDAGIYKMEVTAQLNNGSTDILYDVASVDGDLFLTAVNTNGQSTAFQDSKVENKWSTIGYITNYPGVTSPRITLTWRPGYGTIDGTHRMHMDVIRFTEFIPCLTVSAPGITGPLYESSATVTVTGVNASANTVTVYQDSGSGPIPIGIRTSGITAGNVNVDVSGLVKNARVTATQTVGSQESCVQSNGIPVGGGPNTRIRCAISIRENTAYTGPIGATNMSAGSRIFFLGTSSVTSGAPGADAPLLQPATNWQTLTLTPNVDSEIGWYPAVTNDTIAGTFGVLDALAFAIDDTDTGPYQIYIDDVMCGTTLIQGFEAPTNGTVAWGFDQPTLSGTTSAKILSLPNESVVVTNTAASGSKCLRATFQFNETSADRWLRFTTAAPAGGTPNPQIDLSQPVSINYLLLPPGAVPPPPPSFQPSTNIVVGARTATTLTLTWGVGVLQSTSVLLESNTPWADVVGAVSPYVANTTSGARYYRLRGQ